MDSKFKEGTYFKKGGFYMKIAKIPKDTPHYGSILEPNDVILIETAPLLSITKHYKIYDWVDNSISKEEFDAVYTSTLKTISELHNLN